MYSNFRIEPQLYDFKQLVQDERQELVNSIYELYDEILTGKNVEEFEKTAFYDDMEPDEIHVLTWSDQGKVLGFFIFKVHLVNYSPNEEETDPTYAIFKIYVVSSPLFKGQNIYTRSMKFFSTRYHEIHSNRSLIYFDDVINWITFEKSQFNPNPGTFYPYEGENSKVNSLFFYLKNYFSYQNESDCPFIVKSVSTVKNVHLPPKNRPVACFYREKTQMRDNIGLLTFNLLYLTPDNSLLTEIESPNWMIEMSSAEHWDNLTVELKSQRETNFSSKF